jgi:hypothetical membrane protein
LNGNRFFAVCGIAAPILHLLAMVIGGFLSPSYSHITQAVSELFEVGAPNKQLLNSMLIVSNFMLIMFSIGLHRGIEDKRKSKTAPILLGLGGVTGLLLMLFFPCDPGCEPVTFTGTMHFVTAFSMALLTIISILAFWRRLKDDMRWRGYDKYSLGTFIATIIVMIILGLFITSPFFGLIERISMALILQWIEIMAIKLLSLSL